jgi:hypothetical protein
MADLISPLCSPSARVPRKGWDSEEDKVLLDAIGENTRPDWVVIAARVPFRTARQCRERFTNYLSTTLQSAMAWTPDDDHLLLRLSTEFGCAWQRISVYFPARSQISIKNRYQTLIHRKSPPRPPRDLGLADPDVIVQCFAPKREMRWIAPDDIELLQSLINEALPF